MSRNVILIGFVYLIVFHRGAGYDALKTFQTKILGHIFDSPPIPSCVPDGWAAAGWATLSGPSIHWGQIENLWHNFICPPIFDIRFDKRGTRKGSLAPPPPRYMPHHSPTEPFSLFKNICTDGKYFHTECEGRIRRRKKKKKKGQTVLFSFSFVFIYPLVRRSYLTFEFMINHD